MRYDPLDDAPARTPPFAASIREPRRWLRWLIPVIVAILVGALTGVAVAAAIHMPRVDALADYTPSLVTQLHARDGSVFATFARERRIMLKEGQIPPVLEQAVIASEDSNFFQHGGIDALGIAR
ncbi:MAG TPA: transglycosylase domain-containing protein, partial [Thermoanaerobaculia bacterium]|nr:transglycosylase domain-containing protein [Thermoanaerobaculia bacterium]